jgi:colanic acid/amylovoran biosynthesis glycosyltransferase
LQMSKDNSSRVVIFSPSRNAISETFIRAHIEQLPFDIVARYGSDLAIEDASGKKIWPWGYWVGAVARRVLPDFYSKLRTFFLSRHLKAIKADAVLAEYGTTGSYLAPACKTTGIPLFVHFHGYDASVHDLLASYADSYKYMFAIATGVVAVSEAMKERLLSLGARPETLHVNRCGVDPKRFQAASPDTCPPHFLAVGRFVEKKAPYLTLLAFSNVIQSIPDAKLIMVGAGPLIGPCRKLVASLKLTNSVELLGAQPTETVQQLMRSVRCFVQHSVVAENGDTEGTPVAVIEAQISALPVVATRHAGIPDVVVDNETGFIIEEADVGAMAEAMNRLGKDPMLAKRLGAAARIRALENFTLDQHLRKLAVMISDGVCAHQRSLKAK